MSDTFVRQKDLDVFLTEVFKHANSSGGTYNPRFCAGCQRMRSVLHDLLSRPVEPIPSASSALVGEQRSSSEDKT